MRVQTRMLRTDISEDAFLMLKEKFTEAIAHETLQERIDALEDIIAECAAPLQATNELSPEYAAFLESLTRMHMLMTAEAKLQRLLQPVS